ncbi:MAG: acetolactate synthase small subunit [Dehalococcoidia bacterium]|jgi:acetolactate synthase-1/3 small subunit|nr:acetolactate synthase small subunit [Dehalococcoidia bacterium]
MEDRLHTLVSLVQDEPGVLTRVAGLFRRRGFNIESLSVGHCEQPGLSRMTIVVKGDDSEVDQVTKQLDKLINVVSVTDITRRDMVARELALIKVAAKAEDRSEIMQIVDIYRAKIVDVATESLTVEVTGGEDKIDSLLRLLLPFGITEMARTGRTALTRGSMPSIN